MRAWWTGVLLALGGCSQENPWFIVDDDTTPGSASGVMHSGTEVGTGPGTTTGPVDTTGDTTTTQDTGTDVGTTGPVDPGETTSGDETTGTTGLDETTLTTGTTGAPDDTTDGEAVEGQVWYDLWWRCNHPMTQWAAYGESMGALECWTSLDEPPDQWAGRLIPGVFYMGQYEPEVLALVPVPGVGNSITGTFNGLTLANAVTPHLRVIVGCPDNLPQCDVKGNIRVEREMQTIFGVEEFPVKKGQPQVIDIDLAAIDEADLLDGQPFSVVIVVTLNNGSPGNRGLWLYPRIVELSQ